MARIRPADADRVVETPDPETVLFLLFGPDTGLVSERADRLASAFALPIDDPFALVRFDADRIAENPHLLVEEAGTVSMFAGERLIRISGTTRRNLAAAIRPVLDAPPTACRVILESGDLKPDSAVRKLAEKHRLAAAIGCYRDGPRELAQLITEQLAGHGMTIDPQARSALVPMLGGDRLASRNEIDKLALYCQGRDRVTLDDVVAICGDVSELDVGAVIDHTATGSPAKALMSLDRALAGKTRADVILGMALRHFQQLHRLRSKFDRDGTPAKQLVASLRPPVHFSRRDSLIRAISIWREPELRRALARLSSGFAEARAHPDTGKTLASNTLMALALKAERRPR